MTNDVEIWIAIAGALITQGAGFAALVRARSYKEGQIDEKLKNIEQALKDIKEDQARAR